MMIPACWSRMLVRFWNRRNGGLMIGQDRRTRSGTGSGSRPGRRPARPAAQRGRRAARADGGRRVMRRSTRSCRTTAATIASSVMSGRRTARRRVGPPRMTSDAVGQPEDLLDLVRDEQDRHAAGGEPDEQLVDVALRADVDAAGRLVGDEHRRVDRAGPGRTGASAGCRPTATGRRVSSSARRGRHARSASADRGRARPAADEAEPPSDRRLVRLTFSRIGPPQDQAVVLARLGDHARRPPGSTPRACRRGAWSRDVHLAGGRPATAP